MDCTEFQRVLHPYIDGELDIETILAAQAHIAGCQTCAQRVAHFRALGQEVREAVKIELPAGLRLKAQALMTRRTMVLTRRRLVLSGLMTAAALIIIMMSMVLLHHPTLDDDDVREVVALHIRSQLPGHLIDLETSDREKIMPWFARQLPFTPWVGDLSAHGYTLRGARMDYCDGQRVAVLVYQQGAHLINLVSYPAEELHDLPALTTARNGVNLCGWSRHGLQFFAISDLSQAELAQFPALTHDRSLL